MFLFSDFKVIGISSKDLSGVFFNEERVVKRLEENVFYEVSELE